MLSSILGTALDAGTEDNELLVVKREIGTVLDVKVNKDIGTECTGDEVDEGRVYIIDGLADEETE